MYGSYCKSNKIRSILLKETNSELSRIKKMNTTKINSRCLKDVERDYNGMTVSLKQQYFQNSSHKNFMLNNKESKTISSNNENIHFEFRPRRELEIGRHKIKHETEDYWKKENYSNKKLNQRKFSLNNKLPVSSKLQKASDAYQILQNTYHKMKLIDPQTKAVELISSPLRKSTKSHTQVYTAPKLAGLTLSNLDSLSLNLSCINNNREMYLNDYEEVSEFFFKNSSSEDRNVNDKLKNNINDKLNDKLNDNVNDLPNNSTLRSVNLVDNTIDDLPTHSSISVSSCYLETPMSAKIFSFDDTGKTKEAYGESSWTYYANRFGNTIK